MNSSIAIAKSSKEYNDNRVSFNSNDMLYDENFVDKNIFDVDLGYFIKGEVILEFIIYINSNPPVEIRNVVRIDGSYVDKSIIRIGGNVSFKQGDIFGGESMNPLIISIKIDDSQDIYVIYYSTNNNRTPPLTNASLTVYRNLRDQIKTNLSNDTKLKIINKFTNNNTKIPTINIIGQTLVDGSDVGDMIFVIKDKYKYCKEQSINFGQNKMCKQSYLDENLIKKTIFNKCCPLMVSVFKGNFFTLFLKVKNTWEIKIHPLLTLEFDDFYNNVILYGMSVYILSRLLYGNFNINYLLRINYIKFINNLSKSRFCNFLELYTNPESKIYGYYVYFKYNLY